MKKQHIYNINSIIENILSNLQINDNIKQEDKNEIIENLNDIERKIDNMNNLQLVETITMLNDKYNMLTKQNNELETADSNTSNTMSENVY
jgi:hypothetical protein